MPKPSSKDNTKEHDKENNADVSASNATTIIALKEEINKLNEALLRLMQENAQWRNSVEDAFAELRRRTQNASELSLVSGIKEILNERDSLNDRIQFFRNELREVLQYLINSEQSDTQKTNELRKRINTFLFRNPR